MSQPSCTVCGGTNFTLNAGFYYCSECQTQTQEIEEQEFEFFSGQRITVAPAKGKRKSSNKRNDEIQVLTTWECLNLVLKGLVDEVIALGADPKVKQVTLQLWASYLANIEVAFFSTHKAVFKPRLGITFKRKDAELVYGVKVAGRKRPFFYSRGLKERKWPSQSQTDSSELSSGDESVRLKKLELRKKRNVVAAAEYRAVTSSGSSTATQATLETLGTPEAVLSSDRHSATHSSRLKLSFHAKRIRELITRELGPHNTQHKRMQAAKRIYSTALKSYPNPTLSTVVGVLRLALLVTRSEIQLSDLIRWMAEGHISVYNAGTLLPTNTKVEKDLKRLLCTKQSPLTHSHISEQTYRTACLVRVAHIPTPDLPALAKRFCTELQLPDELMECVHNLIYDCPPRMKFGPATNYEARAMAFIIVALKLFMSLDGVTEYKLSDFASALNKELSQQGDETRLFSWRAWVHYLECRKALVALYHQPIREQEFPTSRMGGSISFFNHNDRNEHSKSEAIIFLNNIKETQSAPLQHLLAPLITEVPESSHLAIPASLTPLTSALQILLAGQSHLLAQPTVVLLEQNFTRHTIGHLKSPDSWILVAKNFLLKVDMIMGTAARSVQESARIEIVNLRPKSKKLICPVTVGITREARKKLAVKRRCLAENLGCDNDGSDSDLNLNVEASRILKKCLVEHFETTCADSVKSLGKQTVGSSENIFTPIDKRKLPQQQDEGETSDLFSENLQESDSVGPYQPALSFHQCYGEYWLYHGQFTKFFMSSVKFDELAAEIFSSSFLWLLRECALTIGVTMRDLYIEVMRVEEMHGLCLPSNEEAAKGSERRFPEWW